MPGSGCPVELNLSIFARDEFQMEETLGGESRRGNLPWSLSRSHFLYAVGIPRARKELETFDVECKAIHFVSPYIQARLTAICSQLSEIRGGPWRNDHSSRKWSTQEGLCPSTIILEMIIVTPEKGEVARLKVM